MISRSGMLAPLVAVLVWADGKLTIDGRGRNGFSLGPQMNFLGAETANRESD
jgi:hypothetical protein